MTFEAFPWTPYILYQPGGSGWLQYFVRGLLSRAGDQNVMYILEEGSLLQM